VYEANQRCDDGSRSSSPLRADSASSGVILAVSRSSLPPPGDVLRRASHGGGRERPMPRGG
jgi:hypothetical protein